MNPVLVIASGITSSSPISPSSYVQVKLVIESLSPGERTPQEQFSNTLCASSPSSGELRKPKACGGIFGASIVAGMKLPLIPVA